MHKTGHTEAGKSAARDCRTTDSTSFKHNILVAGQQKLKKVQVVICFVIWRERCARIFRDEKKMLLVLARERLQEYESWFDVH